VDAEMGGMAALWMDHERSRNPNLKIIKAMIQFVIKTGRFRPKATIAENIGVTEEAGVVERAGGAEETEGSNDESVGSSL
jgi:hypothetical protein